MTAALNARKIEEIMLNISKLFEAAEVDALQLRRLEIEVNRLWAANAISAVDFYTTQSFFAIGKHRREEALAAARNLIALAPASTAAQMNALTVFAGVAEVERAIPLMKILADKHPDDKDLIIKIIYKAADLMQHNFVMQLFHRLDRLTPNEPPLNSVRRLSCIRSLKLMEQFNVTDEDLAARIQVAAKVLAKNGCDIIRHSRRTLSDGSIMYFLHANATIEECASLSFDIAEGIVTNFEDPCSEIVTIACRPFSDLSKMQVLSMGQL